MNIITVNISLDDKVKFWGYQEPGGLQEMLKLRLSSTSALPLNQRKTFKSTLASTPSLVSSTRRKYSLISPIPAPRDIPVSFVGQCYGTMPHIIAWLKLWDFSSNIWQRLAFRRTFTPGDERNLFPFSCKFRIRLYRGFSASDRIKGRDFEVTLMGGLI